MSEDAGSPSASDVGTRFDVAIGFRRNDLQRGLGTFAKWLLVAAQTLLVFSGVVGSIGVFVWATPLLGLMGLALFAWSRFEGLALGTSKGTVVVGADALDIRREAGAERRLARAEIRAALVVQRGHHRYVEIDAAPQWTQHLHAEGDRIRIETATFEEAEALLAQIGASSRRQRIVTASPWRALAVAPVLGFAVWSALLFVGIVLGIAFPAVDLFSIGLVFGPSVLFTVPAYGLAKSIVRPPAIEIGTDGVVLDSGLVRRAVRWDEVVGVETSLAGVPIALRLAGGSRAYFGIASGDRARVEAAARRVAARAEEAIASRANAPRASFAVGESVETFRSRVRTRLDGQGYRDDAPPVADDAVAVLASPHATREERVAAALALRVAGEPEARIRIAAEAFVDAETREALDAVAADDDAKIARILRVPAK